MAPNGSKWLENPPNGLKWLQMAPIVVNHCKKNAKRFQKGAEKSLKSRRKKEEEKIMFPSLPRNDSKLLQMTPNDSKWLEMAQHDSKWLKMA